MATLTAPRSLSHARTCTTRIAFVRRSPRRWAKDAQIIDGLGAVSIVGAGINATYQNVRRGATCMHDHRIASFGLATSSFRATWLVKREQLDDSVRLMHAAFIDRP